MSEKGTKDGQIEWIDALKGIGILCVVAAHVYPGFVSKALYLFHMPLFFFIGGYLLRPKTDLRRYAIDKVRHLLVPYACFLVLIYPFQLYLIFAGGPPHSLFQAVAPPFVGGKMLVGPAAVFWFVTCFFATQQTVNFMVVRMKRQKAMIWMGAMLTLGYANSLLLPRLWLPWNLNVVLMAGPIFYAGYLVRQSVVRFPTWAAVALAGVSLVLLSAGHLDVPDMKSAHYGTPFLALLFSFAWIFVLMAVARGISALPLASHGLRQLGQAAMVIMYAHQSLQLLIKMAVGIDNNTVRFMGAVLGSYLLFLLLQRFPATRMLFLGERARTARTVAV